MMPPPNSPKWIAMRHISSDDDTKDSNTSQKIDPIAVITGTIPLVMLGIISFLIISKTLGIILIVLGIIFIIAAFKAKEPPADHTTAPKQ